MSRPVFTAAQSRERDRYAMEVLGIPSLLLMEHAAMGLAGLVREKGRIVVCCGPGNNGQDGLALARILDSRGADVCCVILSEKGLGQQYGMVQTLDIPVWSGLEEAQMVLADCDLVVDGLFGSGLNRNVEGDWARLVDLMNGCGAPVLSIDVPSGLDGTSGKVLGAAVQASVTGCLDGMKSGLLMNEGPRMAGRVHVLPIGIPDWVPVPAYAQLIDEKDAAWCLPERTDFGHKGDFGRLLAAGGSSYMVGAPVFAAKAGFASGAGLLYMGVPDQIRGVVQTLVPEAVQIPFGEILERAEEFDCITAGNGMGRDKEVQALISELLKKDVPLVLDADGLFGLDPGLLVRDAPVVLTPHLGEFARLTGQSVEEVQADPILACRKFCAEHENVVLVLKSSVTCIGWGELVFVWHRPDSALSKGGSGDVLAGIIGGLLAQTADGLASAVCGVAALGMAAGMAVNGAANTPMDLIAALGSVWNQLKKEAGQSASSIM